MRFAPILFKLKIDAAYFGTRGRGAGIATREAKLAGDKSGSELTDNVVVMRLRINDDAGRLAEVIMIEQRRQQDCDRDRQVAPHAFFENRGRTRSADGHCDGNTETTCTRQRGTAATTRSIPILN